MEIKMCEADALMLLNLLETVNELVFDFATWAVGSNDFQSKLETLKNRFYEKFDAENRGDDFVFEINLDEIDTLKTAFAIWNRLAVATDSRNDAAKLANLLKITV